MVIKHKHHLVPKHVGGANNHPSNLIEVTIEEHAQIHYELWLKEGRWQDYLAWKGLSGQLTHEEAIEFISRLPKTKEHNKKNSDALKVLFKSGKRSNKGSNNPMYGKRHSKEAKRKIKENHFKTLPHNAEWNQNISKGKKGKKRPPFSAEWRENMSKARQAYLKRKKDELDLS